MQCVRTPRMRALGLGTHAHATCCILLHHLRHATRHDKGIARALTMLEVDASFANSCSGGPGEFPLGLAAVLPFAAKTAASFWWLFDQQRSMAIAIEKTFVRHAQNNNETSSTNLLILPAATETMCWNSNRSCYGFGCLTNRCPHACCSFASVWSRF